MSFDISIGTDASKSTRGITTSKQSAWRIYRRLLGYAWQYKGRLILSLFFAILVAASFMTMIVSVGTAINLLFPGTPDPANEMAQDAALYAERLQQYFGIEIRRPEQRFLDAVHTFRADPMTALIWLSAGLVGVAFIGGLARYLQEYFAGWVGARISISIGEAMYANILRQPLAFFETHTTGEIIARFTNDIFMVNTGLSAVFIKLTREPVKMLFFLWVALSIDPLLTLIGLGALPPVAVVIVKLGKKLKKSVKRSLERMASMATVVNETFSGITIVKGYGMETREAARFNSETVRLRRFLMQIVRANAAVGPATEFLLVIGLAAFVLFSGYQVTAGRLQAGDLVQLYAALALMLDPVRKLSAVNNQVQTSVASGERVFELMDLEPSILEAPNAVDIPRLKEALRFEDVHFSYDGEVNVLSGLTFEALHGEMAALVGFSGAGKSTTAKLVPRFYDATSGRVTFDGVDVRDATFKSLRGQVGFVPQETLLFNRTVRDNIAFGLERFDEEDIVRAAKLANAHDFITALPKGYDTLLGEGGAGLSGGQRQRLAIARALVKDPAVLILDEATSSLDSESEQAIQDALSKFVVGRTTLVIAHRLSTIMRADRILVLHEGRVAEQGTHEQLLAKGGLYHRLYETQFAEKVRA